MTVCVVPTEGVSGENYGELRIIIIFVQPNLNANLCINESIVLCIENIR